VVCFRNVIVNTRHKDDKKYNNNNNNNNGMRTIKNKCYEEYERIVTNEEENVTRVETGKV